MLLFVFDGGLLSVSWRERIRLDMDELVNFAFVPVDEVDRLLPPLHARRVAAAARLRRTPWSTASRFPFSRRPMG